MQAVPVQGGVAGDGYLAAALQAVVHGPLGQDALGGIRVVQGRDEGAGAGVAGAALDADGPLPDGRQGLVRLEEAADARCETQSYEPGGGQDDGLVVSPIEPGQAGVDVTPQRLDTQVRPAL